MEGTPKALSAKDKAKAAVEVSALARILQMTATHLRTVLAEPTLSEFVASVGKNELVADVQSVERIAASMREDVETYKTTLST